MAAFQKLRHLLLLLLAVFILPAAGFALSVPQVQLLEPIRTGLYAPVRMAEDGAGNFYLTDPKAGGLLKFDRTGLLKATLTLKKPQGVAVTDSGNLIVGQGDAVSVMDSSGNPKFMLGKGAGQFKMADGIAVDSAGYIYVVDSLDNCVQVFNSSGAAVSMGTAAAGKPGNSFGSSGSGNGQFSMPTGIAFEKESGQLAVADTLNGRVQFIDLAGVWKRSIGQFGSGALRFTSPVSVAFEYAPGSSGALKRMYVTDSFQSSIQVIDPAATPVWLGFIGSYGRANGKLMNPSDALIDPVGGRLLVANGFGNITVFGINGGGTPIVDTTPPLFTVNPVTQVTSSRTVTVTGTIEAGARLSLSLSSAAVVGTPVLTSPTEWSVTITDLVQGANDITITATDSAGNVAPSQMFTVTYSPTAVGLTIDRVTSPTNSSSQTISGTVDAGATVSVSVNTGATAVTTMNGSTWSSSITGLLSGVNIITVIAANSGSETAVSRTSILLSTTPPQLFLSMVQDGSVTSSPILTVNGLTDITIPTVTINGVTVNTVQGQFSKGLLLGSGANSITVTATDLAGNSSTVIRNVIFDPAAPVVTIISPVGGEVTNQNIIQVTGSSSAGSSTVIKVNGTVQATLSASSWTATVNLGTGVGIYTLEAVATAADKTASSAVTLSLVDLTVPPVNLAFPPRDLATNSSSLAVSGSAGGASVTATLNGVSVPITFDPVTGKYALALIFTTEGVSTLAVTATDAFGNSSTVIRTLMYDITSPPLSVTAQSPSLVSGNGEPGSVVAVKDAGGGAVGTTVVGSSGAWSLPLTGSEPQPLNIYALDAAGNSSRNGDINGSGGPVDIFDALIALRIAINLNPNPQLNSQAILKGDVGPLKNGIPMPDGKIDIDDVVVIMMKITGLI